MELVYPCTKTFCLFFLRSLPCGLNKGKGEAVNTTLHFINEADESFIDGDKATSLFVLMYIRVLAVYINIGAGGEGSVRLLDSLW
jgi:hypothetical protein